MKWDFTELNSLCAKENIPDSRIYQKALIWKKELALFHSKQSNDVWNSLFSRHKKLIVGEKKWQDTHLASEAHVIAAAQALHSMGDILGQIINQVLLSGALSEDDVTLNNVLTSLANRGSASNIVAEVLILKNSSEFKYISAFVNITKHRRILETDFHAEGGIDTRNDQGIRFKQFNYGRNQFPIVWAKDIVGSYKNKIFHYICNIGIAVNSHLKNNFI